MPLRAQPDHAALDPANQIAPVQAQLDELARELEHAQRLATLGTLAAGIAHEINNVLTPVLAYAQLASSNPEDRKLQSKAISKAIQGVQTATQITQAMLGFAADPDEPDWANVRDVLQLAIDCVGRDPAKDRIDLKIDVPDDLHVRMRPLALQQVLMNLMLNACAVLRGRGGELSIVATDQGDGAAVIGVSDTGPGIPQEVVGRLFTPFASSRRHQSGPDNRRPEGTGLGLAICRRLVESAAGSITVASKPGHGATFTIVLPTARISQAMAG